MADEDALEQRLTVLLEKLADLMDKDPEAAVSLVDDGDHGLAANCEVRLARCHAVWLARGPEAALACFEVLVREHPDYADAQADLAAVCDELGDEERRNELML